MREQHHYGVGKIAVFLLNRMPEGEAAEVISELNMLLTKMGCGSIEVKEDHDSIGNKYYPAMIIHMNAAAAAGYNRRDAGRKPKFLEGHKAFYRVGEIKKMLENRTANEVAEELGISRSTLFRRLKDKDDERYF